MSRRFDKQPTSTPATPAKKPASGDRGFVGYQGTAAAAAGSEQTQGGVTAARHGLNHNPAVTSAQSSTTTTTPAATQMDKIKLKLASLREEADHAVTRAEEAEGKNKKYELELLAKDQEIQSLQHKLGLLEAELDKAEAKLGDLKHAAEDSEAGKSSNEALNRKVQLLEEELDASEKNVKETVEKLRQVDVKAEHFERQVQRLEQERDAWEKKCEEAEDKYRRSQAELAELERTMGDI